MNINKDIVNRSLERAGQEPLNTEDVEKNTSRWRLIKSYYLPTIMETLSATAWTSRKVRKELTEHDGDNLSSYLYAYDLPVDCTKPEALIDNEEYEVEGKILYTNVESPTLLYISNGYVGKRYEAADPQPTSETYTEYFIYDEETESYESASGTEYSSEVTYYQLSTDDFPEYDEIVFEPLLEEFIEARLASKIVLKITGDVSLYQLLYNEAVIAERKAIDASTAHGANKENGQEWWADTLGLN